MTNFKTVIGQAGDWETEEGSENEEEIKKLDGGSVEVEGGWITAGGK